MLTLYQPRRVWSEDDSGSEGEKVIPAGKPYLTKINGQLVMAREKRDRNSNIAIDLLGEAFGVRTRVIRKRAKSLEGTPAPLLIGGVPYVPQQQLTYTSPIPQQPFSSSTIQLPQYQQHQQLSLPAPKPTQHDFDQLKRIDAHFNKVQRYSVAPVLNSNDETATRTTITITKHICANCRRLRSKKYHHDNPMKPGETPVPAFCRKCQRDNSSTSCSDISRHAKEKEKMKGKSKKHHKKASKSSSSNSSRSPEPKKPQKPQPKKEAPRRVPSEELIIVEEEFSEEEKLSRGRSSRRVEAGEVIFEERHPLSPLTSQSARPRSRSSGRHKRYGIPRKPVRQQRVQETIRQRSLSPQYQYVQAPAASTQNDPLERTHPRRVPIHFVEDDVYESAAPARAPNNIHREPSHQTTVPIREYSFEERESGPSRSQESSQRRRRERLILNDRIEPPLPPWEGPHVIHPRPGDEAVVVTERYVYRPRNLPPVEEERRMQERVDKIMLGARSRTAEYTTEEEASRYYHDDWAREEPVGRSEPVRRREPRRRGYRREVHQDSELAGSEDSLDYARIDHRAPQNLPRASSPPLSATASSTPDIWQDRPPYPLSSDSEAARRVKAAKKGKAVQRNPSQSRSRSTNRPPFVREETDGGTEKALVPSPKFSTGREPFPDDVSDITERERIVEAETRHVSFREPGSEKDAHEGWTESVRPESSVGERGE